MIVLLIIAIQAMIIRHLLLKEEIEIIVKEDENNIFKKEFIIK